MRRACHSPAAVGVTLLVSVIVNLYFIYTNNYNERLIDQLQQALNVFQTEEKNKLFQSTSSNTDSTLPDELAVNNHLYWKYFKKLFIAKPSESSVEQFTIVMMTYKRSSIVRRLIPHYCETGHYLNKFILIWNDVGGVIPKDILHHECDVPFEIKLPSENKLTNRFYPYSDLETDAIFMIDDDRLILHQDLIFAFQSWQQYRHRIMGFEFRTHTVFSNGTYFYGATSKMDEKLGYSLLISANFLIHKAYMEMFHIPEFMNTSMIEYINHHMNCEDLAMCIMVADFLSKVSYPQTSCIGLKPKHYPYNLEGENHEKYKGLSIRPTHVNGRKKCLNEFKKYYKNGVLPIQYTNVLFVHEPESYYATEKKTVHTLPNEIDNYY